jgi:hypothetical protein
MNSLMGFNNLYPTPPSDNDEASHDTSSGYNIALKASNYYITPKIADSNNCYGLNSVENKYPLTTQYHPNNTSNQSFEENSQQTNVDESNKENDSQQANSRFKRRSRTTYTKNQLDTLEATFQRTHYPEIRVVDDLSTMLNLSIERISIWFQNRRARFKKARKLETHDSRFDESQYLTPNQSVPGSSYPYEPSFNLPKPALPTPQQVYGEEKPKEVSKFLTNYPPSYSFPQHKTSSTESPPAYQVPVNSSFVPNTTASLNSMSFYQPYLDTK